MTDEVSTWDEVRRLTDELEVKIHLAGLDARDRWHELEPRVAKLERVIVHSAKRAAESAVDELHEVRDALRALRDEIQGRVRGDHG